MRRRAFTSPVAFTVEENQPRVGFLVAWDGDALDVVVDCQITGGVDAVLFEIRDGDRLVFRTGAGLRGAGRRGQRRSPEHCGR